MTGSVGRREFIRRSLLAGGALLMSPMAAACRGPGPSDTLSQAQEQGFIRVGFADEAPYGYVSNSGRLTGEAPELAREVMRRLGVSQLDGLLTPFGSLIAGLQEGRFDLIAAGMFITPERCGQIIFSDPDYCAQQAFLLVEGNPFGISRYEDIVANPTVELGVVTGAVEVTQARESGVRLDQVNRFDTVHDMLQALQEGRIDAAALTTISLANLARISDFTGVEVTEGFAYRGELGCGAFGFRQDDTRLRAEFNRILHQMRDNDELTRIVEPFGFVQAAEAARGLTAQDLCDR